MRVGNRHRSGKPPQRLFERRVKNFRRGAFHDAKGEVELTADFFGVVAGERESHQDLRVDFGIRVAEALVEEVSGLIIFGRDGFGEVEIEFEHGS